MNFRMILALFIFIFMSCPLAKAQEFYDDFGENTYVESSKFDFGLLVGFSRMPILLREGYIYGDLPGFFLVDEVFNEIKINRGFHLGVMSHFDENWYLGFSFTNNVAEKPLKRGKDDVFSVGLDMGYQIQVLPQQNFLLLAFETGLAVHSINRRFNERGDFYSVRINRTALALTPSIRLDINLFLEKIYLFFQAKYFFRFYDRAAIVFEQEETDIDDDRIVSRIRFSNTALQSSPSSRLQVNHIYQFSLGLRFNLNF